jgi:hypothetical protein
MRKPIDANPERLYLTRRFEYVDVESRRDAELGGRQTVDPTSGDQAFHARQTLGISAFSTQYDKPHAGTESGRIVIRR